MSEEAELLDETPDEPLETVKPESAEGEPDAIRELLKDRKEAIERLERQNKRLRSRLRKRAEPKPEPEPEPAVQDSAVVEQPKTRSADWWTTLTGE